MDFDLAQVRAFVAVAELRHFGKAAARLHLTQQALSKRIQRLERLLGELLFVRDSRTVEVTEAGTRFLPHALALLTLADAAVADARSVSRPVRVDVWGHLHPPLRWMRRLASAEPPPAIEVSMRRSLGPAIEALLRGEVDVAFGRVFDLEPPVPDELRHRLVYLSPGGALMSAQHPLAQADVLRAADLVAREIWVPAGSPPEMMGYYRRLATHLGSRLISDGTNLGLEHVLEHVRGDSACVMVTTMDLPVPQDSGARLIPLIEPCPSWPWSMLWRNNDRNPGVAELVCQMLRLSHAEGMVTFDPTHDWLPDPDLADLLEQTQGDTALPGSD